MARSPEVYEATKSYVVAALHYLNESQSPEPTSAIQWERWVRSEPGTFHRQQFVEEAWSPALGLDEEIHALSEYAACLVALQRDAVIAPQLDTLVGTASGSHRIDVHTVPDGILTRLATEARGWRFDEARFDAQYDDYESSLFADSFTYTLVAPLPGLTSDALPIHLRKDVVVTAMTEEEAVTCVRVGLFQPLGGAPIVSMPSETALRATVSLPKVIGEGDSERGKDEMMELDARFREIVQCTLLSLRLTTSNRIVAPGHLYFSSDWPLRGGTTFGPLSSSAKRTMFAAPYALDGESVDDFRDVWTQLRHDGVTRHRELGVALRRFSDAGDRDRDDDALIDLMISAEALFVPERDELGYRLALRIAFFIAEEMGLTKEEVFRHMKRAYSARSKLVHGDLVADLELADGTRVPLRDFVRVTDEHLRTALRKSVRLASESPNARGFADWEALIFDGG